MLFSCKTTKCPGVLELKTQKHASEVRCSKCFKVHKLCSQCLDVYVNFRHHRDAEHQVKYLFQRQQQVTYRGRDGKFLRNGIDLLATAASYD